MAIRIVRWNGTEVPEGFRDLPPGEYFVGPVEDVSTLTPAEEDGILRAMEELDSGEGIPHEVVMEGLRARLRQR